MLNRVEFVLTHVWYTMAVSVLYLILNGVYVGVSGSYIYNILKWDGAFTAGAIIACALFLIGMYVLGRFLANKRNQYAGRTPVAEGKWCLCARSLEQTGTQ